MKRKKPQAIFIHIFVIFLFYLLSGTGAVHSQKIEAGLGIGGLVYWGDLSPDAPLKNFNNLRFGAQGFIRSDVTRRLNLRFNFLVGGLAGDDAHSNGESRKSRNLSFKSMVKEFSVLAEYSFLNWHLRHLEDGLSFYVAGGVSLLQFNPKAEYQGITYELQPLGTEGQGIPGFADNYSLLTFGIPFGGGMKIKLTENLSINPEIMVKFTFSDYIDDISGSYVNYNELRSGNGELAAIFGNRQGEYLGQSEPVFLPTGSQRGGPNSDDLYFVGMVNFVYLLSSNGSIFAKKGINYDTYCPTF